MYLIRCNKKTRIMKNSVLRLLVLVLLIFTGCGKCGKNINLGNFELIPESIENWFPYRDVNELTFKNAEGGIMTLRIKEQEKEMIHNVHREICSESITDNALEVYWGESLYVKYHGKYDNVNYSISIMLRVVEIYYNDEITDLRLKDKASYSFEIYNDGGWLFGGVYSYTVDYRGNTIPDENGDGGIPDFLNVIDINGKAYNDVWHFYREGVPSFYFQQEKGIIVFQGLDDEVWELQ